MSKLRAGWPTCEPLVGQEVGVSDWIIVDQARIDQFADATGDHQWIHVDPRARRGRARSARPIAHGFLTLSLLPPMSHTAFDDRRHARWASTTA